jgi:hypothetical protein
MLRPRCFTATGDSTGCQDVDFVFGNTALKGNATIPEPSVAALVFLAAVGWFVFHAKKRLHTC